MNRIILPIRLLATMSEKALANGTACPKIIPGKLRLYSMRFCPYAERCHLVLNAKKVPYEVVNVNLKDKPDWLLAMNPLGKVPLLQLDDKVVVESLVICDHVDDDYPDPPMYQQADDRTADKTLMDIFVKVTQKFYVFALNKEPTKSKEESWKGILDELVFWEDEIQKRGTPFFTGSNPGMVDYMIWPWMERLEVMEVIHGLTPLGADQRLQRVDAWISKMKKDPVIQETSHPISQHVQFIDSIVAGKVDYDIGL